MPSSPTPPRSPTPVTLSRPALAEDIERIRERRRSRLNRSQLSRDGGDKSLSAVLSQQETGPYSLVSRIDRIFQRRREREILSESAKGSPLRGMSPQQHVYEEETPSHRSPTVSPSPSRARGNFVDKLRVVTSEPTTPRGGAPQSSPALPRSSRSQLPVPPQRSPQRSAYHDEDIVDRPGPVNDYSNVRSVVVSSPGPPPVPPRTPGSGRSPVTSGPRSADLTTRSVVSFTSTPRSDGGTSSMALSVTPATPITPLSQHAASESMTPRSGAQFSTPPRRLPDNSSLAEVVRVKYDFKPTQKGDLALRKGDTVVVLSRDQRNWWTGEVNRKVGRFPVTYCESLSGDAISIGSPLSERHQAEPTLKMSGVIFKRSGVAWVKKFAELKGDLLTLFKSRNNLSVVGYLGLTSDATVSKIGDEFEVTVFTDPRRGRRVYRFKAQSRSDSERWVEALKEAISEAPETASVGGVLDTPLSPSGSTSSIMSTPGSPGKRSKKPVFTIITLDDTSVMTEDPPASGESPSRTKSARFSHMTSETGSDIDETLVKSGSAKPGSRVGRPSVAYNQDVVSSVVRATLDYPKPFNEGDLSFKRGDTIVVINKASPSWWLGELNGKRGRFSVNLMEFMTGGRLFDPEVGPEPLPEYSALLELKSGVMYQKRWCTLFHNTVLYTKAEDDPVLRGYFEITPRTSIEQTGELVIEITLDEPERKKPRKILIRCENHRVTKTWMTLLVNSKIVAMGERSPHFTPFAVNASPATPTRPFSVNAPPQGSAGQHSVSFAYSSPTGVSPMSSQGTGTPHQSFQSQTYTSPAATSTQTWRPKGVQSPTPKPAPGNAPPAQRSRAVSQADVVSSPQRQPDAVHPQDRVGVGRDSVSKPLFGDLLSATALYAYRATSDEELPLSEGDVVVVLVQNDDGWWFAVKVAHFGLFPSNYTEVVPNDATEHTYCNALFDYTPADDTELALHAGDMVLVAVEDAETGWWYGAVVEDSGLIPSTYVSTNPVDIREALARKSDEPRPAKVVPRQEYGASIPPNNNGNVVGIGQDPADPTPVAFLSRPSVVAPREVRDIVSNAQSLSGERERDMEIEEVDTVSAQPTGSSPHGHTASAQDPLQVHSFAGSDWAHGRASDAAIASDVKVIVSPQPSSGGRAKLGRRSRGASKPEVESRPGYPVYQNPANAPAVSSPLRQPATVATGSPDESASR